MSLSLLDTTGPGRGRGRPPAARLPAAGHSVAVDLAGQIARWKAMELHALRTAFRKAMHRRPGPGLTRSLLIRVLAYRLQVDAQGGLDPATERTLDAIEARLAAGHPGGKGLVTPLPRRGLQPGTVLVREWNGIMEPVTVTADGFLWRGEAFVSLSAVARAMTGTRWNGWVFFGLRKARDEVQP